MIMETIKVKRDGPKGYRLINRADFDPAIHVAFDAPEAPRITRKRKAQDDEG
jgi:hypothetical protein